jgi:hypothetical protein
MEFMTVIVNVVISITTITNTTTTTIPWLVSPE